MKTKILKLIVLVSLFSVAFSQVQVYPTVSPQFLFPDSSGYIQLTFKTIANNSSIKILTIFTDAPLTFIGNTSDIDLGSISANEVLNYFIKFKVDKNAKPGNYIIYFIIESCANNICNEITISTPIQIQSKQKIEIISINPTSFLSGEKANITIKLLNRESFQMENIIVTLNTNSTYILPFGKTNTYFINYIDPNKIYELNIPISISPFAYGIIPIVFSIQYTDSSGNIQYYSYVSGIEIIPKIDFDLILKDFSQNELTLEIINTGYFQANSVVVKPEQGLIPQEYNAGNLQPGDYTSLSFQLLARNLTRTINFEIFFTDNLGYRRNVSKEIKLFFSNFNITKEIGGTIRRTQTQQVQQFNYSYIFVGIVGILIIIFVFRYLLKAGKK